MVMVIFLTTRRVSVMIMNMENMISEDEKQDQ